MTTKPHYSPSEIAARVVQNMKLSAPDVDLNTLVDMKELENALIDTLREVRLLVPHMKNNPVSKH